MTPGSKTENSQIDFTVLRDDWESSGHNKLGNPRQGKCDMTSVTVSRRMMPALPAAALTDLFHRMQIIQVGGFISSVVKV